MVYQAALLLKTIWCLNCLRSFQFSICMTPNSNQIPLPQKAAFSLPPTTPREKKIGAIYWERSL